ncbi:hypothetical protein [Herbiconiux sp. UC225_62]|uniref:hypothetical protein n=1 Tax=Herbiconiux sp. UC225_62 TaxID=3350168 RepID=UPI0036D38F89
MNPLGQIAAAVIGLAVFTAACFLGTRALIRYSPSDPGDIDVEAPDGNDQA